MIFDVNTTLFPDTDGFRLEVSIAVVASTTCSVRTLELDTAWLVSPEYVTTIECGPNTSELVVKLAVPLAARVTEPSEFAPSVKFTVPPGAMVLPVVTVAVNVTALPRVTGFTLLTSAVVVVACTTTCCTTAEVLVV
jgi:hypothetical protein